MQVADDDSADVVNPMESLEPDSETSEVVNLLSSMLSRLDILRSEITSRRQFHENNRVSSSTSATPQVGNQDTESLPSERQEETNQEENHAEAENNNENNAERQHTTPTTTTESFNPPIKDISHLVTIGCRLDSRPSYLRWSLLIKMALKHNHLYHIIDPDVPTPEDPSEIWKRQDNFVELLLLSTVSEKWESFVIYSRNSKEAWILLKGAFHIEDSTIMRENYKEIFTKAFNPRKDDVVEFLAQIQCRFQTLKFLGYETPEDSQAALVVANLPTKFYQEVTKKLDIDSTLTYEKLQKVMVSIQLQFYAERKEKLETARQLRRITRQEQRAASATTNDNDNTLSTLTPTRDPTRTRRQRQRSRKTFRRMIRNRKGARSRGTEENNSTDHQQQQRHQPETSTSARTRIRTRTRPSDNSTNTSTRQRQRQRQHRQRQTSRHRRSGPTATRAH